MMTNVILVLMLVLISGFFSASETAYTSINALRLKRAAESGDKRAGCAYYIYEHFDQAISAILIGNNLVNIVASSIATTIFITLMGPSGAGVASIAMTQLVLMFGEISPKIIAKQMSDRLARWFAYPLRALMFVFAPLAKAGTFLVDRLAAWLLPQKEEEPTITEEEFQAILDTVEDEGVFDEERTDLLQSALNFDEVSVQQVMTPRVDMFALDIEDPLPEQLEAVIEAGYSRVPVYEDTIDHIIGILHTNHFLERMVDDGQADIRAMLIEAPFLHKTMTLDDALRLMRHKQVHIGIVIDEYGGTMGMLTLEDILEELVGEIWDEGDDIVEECRDLGDGRYECAGTMSIHEFFDEIDYEPADFECEYTTLGGWAVEQLDAMPKEGKQFTFDRLRVTVLKMEGMRVERLLIELLAPDPEEDQ